MDLKTYVSLDGIEMAKLVRAKEVKASELLACSITLIEEVQGTYHGMTNIRKIDSKEINEQIKKDGIFSGVPIALKDTQAMAGEKLTYGSTLWKNYRAKKDSHFVRKLKDAGSLLIGHTTTPEFALKNITEAKIHGPTRNPWNARHSPGGSSGGSATLVALGVVPIAGASDGGGSIRIPASFTNLFGLKPTRGRTPVGPGVGRQWHGAAIDFVLSRSVRDSAAMLDVLKVIQPEAAFQAPLHSENYLSLYNRPLKKRLKIAFSTESPVGTPVSEEAKRAVQKVVQWLEEEGHSVEEVNDTGVDGIELMRHYFMMNSGEVASMIQRLEQSLGRKITEEDVEIETWVLNVAGKHVSAIEFSNSLLAWDQAAEQMTAFHESYDLYLTPTTAYPAPKVGELTPTLAEKEHILLKLEQEKRENYQDFIYEMFLPSLTYTPFTQLANLTGQPAVSVPVHLTKEGLPLGVQLMAQKGMEHLLLQVAQEIEQSDLWVPMNKSPFYQKILNHYM